MDIPIIDSHIHLWDPQHVPLDWLEKAPAHLNQAYLIKEYEHATEGLNIEGMVYLETDCNPHYTLLEAQWVVERMVKVDKRIMGVVPYAPVQDGEGVRGYIEALLLIGTGEGVVPGSHSAGKTLWSGTHIKERPQLVKGVRRLLQSEPVGLATQRAFIEGVQLLGAYGLSFDIGVKPMHLPDAIVLVENCPNVQFVLDHMGKPQPKAPHKADQQFSEWCAHITRLAQFPNVYAKFSGITTEADAVNGEAWSVKDLQPYFEHYFNAFGEDRIMFGSDWPVVLLGKGVTYKKWVSIAAELTQHLSAETRLKIFNTNAKKFYRL